jgi:hypothetical protein
MEDRELLELAAKAAGMGSVLYVPMSRDKGDFMVEEFDGGPLKPWNPLSDDGDALRLAVKLDLTICRPGSHPAALVRTDDAQAYYNADCARRAIVRAAAEIGRTKP